MNRKERRQAVRDPGACKMCQFMVSIIGPDADRWQDPAGNKIEPTVMQRVEAMRFGKSGRWAPLCAPCAQLAMGWLQLREVAHQQKMLVTSKIIVPGKEEVRKLSGGLVVPGGRV